MKKSYFLLRKYMFTNLVFDGGGARGIAFCGALKILENRNLIKNVKKIAGTSVGAIVASLIAIGYNSSELTEAILNLKSSDIFDNSKYKVANFYYLITRFGWYRGDKMLESIEKMLFTKTGDADITFREVYQKYGKELVIVATNLSKKQATYFNHRDNPHLEIKNAIRMSISVPFYFDPIEYKNEIYIDGGILDSYPFDYFNDDENTLGFKLKFKLLVRKDKNLPIKNFKNYFLTFIDTIINRVEELHLKDHYLDQSVIIDALDVGILEFDLTREKKLELIERGEIATNEYFSNHNI